MGGFIGAVLRYIINLGFEKIDYSIFPIGTLIINFIGCFLLGSLINFDIISNEEWPANEFMVIGVLGGFTTFSTFANESLRLLEMDHFYIASIYILISIFSGLGGIWLSRLFQFNILQG